MNAIKVIEKNGKKIEIHVDENPVKWKKWMRKGEKIR